MVLQARGRDRRLCGLRSLERGFETHAAKGQFRSAQVHTRLAPETVRDLLRRLVQELTELEDESEPLQTVTFAFHPAIEQGETD